MSAGPSGPSIAEAVDPTGVDDPGADPPVLTSELHGETIAGGPLRSGSTRALAAHGDDGAGLLSGAAGLLVFLGFMLFTTQLLVDLYASSVVTGAAHSGARVVAGARVDHTDAASLDAARSEGERRVRQLLGRHGQGAQLDWSGSTADEIVLRVVVDNPRFALPGVGARLGVDRVDRTVRVRVEELR